MRWFLIVLAPLLLLPAAVYAQTAPQPTTPLPPGQVPAGVSAVIAQQVAARGDGYDGDCQQVTVLHAGRVCSLTTAQADGSWTVQIMREGSPGGPGLMPAYSFSVSPDQAAAATPVTLAPDAVPAGVTAVIAAHVANENYIYAGDCGQATDAQAGQVCSLTTAQDDGTWLVRLYPVEPNVPLAQYPYEQFTITPDQVAGA
jgi:hypothetical protein